MLAVSAVRAAGARGRGGGSTSWLLGQLLGDTRRRLSSSATAADPSAVLGTAISVRLSGGGEGPAAAAGGRGVIEVAGPDACKLLQGLITNDVALLQQHPTSEGGPMFTAFLTAKGRIMSEAFVIVPAQEARGAAGGGGPPERLLLDVPGENAGLLLRHLRMYKLRSKVTITDRSRDLSVWAVLMLPPDDQQPGSSSHGRGGLVARAVASGWQGGWDPRWPGLGLRLIGPAHNSHNHQQQHPAQALGLAAASASGAGSSSREGGVGEYEAARLAAGLGEGRHEMADRILAEVNVDLQHGVSFCKGCYLGQELTARTQFKGVVRKRLLPFRLLGSPPPPPASTGGVVDRAVSLSSLLSQAARAAAATPHDVKRALSTAAGAGGLAVVDLGNGGNNKKVGDVVRVVPELGLGLALVRLEDVLGPATSFGLAASPPPAAAAADGAPQQQGGGVGGVVAGVSLHLPPWWPADLDLRTGKPRPTTAATAR